MSFHLADGGAWLRRSGLAAVRSRTGRVLQIAVTLALTVWILAALDPRSWAALRDVDAATLALAILLFASAQISGGLRLALLMADPRLSASAAIVATWIGYFAANFLPSTVGGDVVRAVRLKGLGLPLARVAGVLVLDRLLNLGMIALILALSAGGWAVASWRDLDPHLAALAAGVGLIAVAALALLAWRAPPVRRVLHEAAQPVVETWRHPLRLALALLLSFLSIGAAILSQWTVARSLGIPVSLVELAGIICAVTLLVLLPISLNGLGLQEGGFIVLLTGAGSTFDQALAFALLSRVLIVAAGIIGGLVLAWDRLAASRRAGTP